MEDSVGMIANTEAYKNDSYVPKLNVSVLNEHSKIRGDNFSLREVQEITSIQTDRSVNFATSPTVANPGPTPRELNIQENNKEIVVLGGI
jgi:hypothetical protein